MVAVVFGLEAHINALVLLVLVVNFVKFHQ
jgi:hypothetical protein